MQKKAKKQVSQKAFFSVLGIVVVFSLLVYLGTTGLVGRATTDVQGDIFQVTYTPGCETNPTIVAQDVFEEVISSVLEEKGCSEDWCYRVYAQGLALPGKDGQTYVALGCTDAQAINTMLSTCQQLLATVCS